MMAVNLSRKWPMHIQRDARIQVLWQMAQFSLKRYVMEGFVVARVGHGDR